MLKRPLSTPSPQCHASQRYIKLTPLPPPLRDDFSQKCRTLSLKVVLRGLSEASKNRQVSIYCQYMYMKLTTDITSGYFDAIVNECSGNTLKFL